MAILLEVLHIIRNLMVVILGICAMLFWPITLWLVFLYAVFKPLGEAILASLGGKTRGDKHEN